MSFDEEENRFRRVYQSNFRVFLFLFSQSFWKCSDKSRTVVNVVFQIGNALQPYECKVMIILVLISYLIKGLPQRKKKHV